MKECSHKTLFIYESSWQTGFGSHATVLLTPVLGKYLDGPGLVIVIEFLFCLICYCLLQILMNLLSLKACFNNYLYPWACLENLN